jgi:hypothetical protein
MEKGNKAKLKKLQANLTSIGYCTEATSCCRQRWIRKAGDLQAALEYQEKIYKYLSKSPEPVGPPARAELKTTVDKLAALYEQVVALELSIETYLHPAPVSLQTPRKNLPN